jgi:hypothetical protein
MPTTGKAFCFSLSRISYFDGLQFAEAKRRELHAIFIAFCLFLFAGQSWQSSLFHQLLLDLEVRPA